MNENQGRRLMASVIARDNLALRSNYDLGEIVVSQLIAKLDALGPANALLEEVCRRLEFLPPPEIAVFEEQVFFWYRNELEALQARRGPFASRQSAVAAAWLDRREREAALERARQEGTAP